MSNIMWTEFAILIVASTLLAIVPGYFILRALRLSRQVALCAATPVSILCYVVWGIVLYGTGLRGFAPMLGCVLATCCAALVLSAFIHRARAIRTQTATKEEPELDFRVSLFSIAFNAIVIGLFFIWQLDTPESIIQAPDNAAHLGYIRSMMNSGLFSTLHVSYYLDVSNPFAAPLQGSSYYPAGWHLVPAILGNICGADPGILENAWSVALFVMSYPLGVSLLLQLAMPKRKAVALGGAIVCCAGAMFPYRAILVHATYPLLAGFGCAPVVAALFVGVFRTASGPLYARKAFMRLDWAVACVLALAGVATIHPSAAIFAVLLCAPYFFFNVIPSYAKHSKIQAKHRSAYTAILQILFLILCAAAWYALYKSPIMSGVVDYRWQYYDYTVSQAILSIFDLSLLRGIPQYVLGALALVGSIWGVFKRDARWLVVSFGLVAFIYIATVSIDALRPLLSGFWYTDNERIAMMLTVAMVPVEAMGLGAVVSFISSAFAKIVSEQRNSRFISGIAASTSALCAVLLFAPPLAFIAGHGPSTALGDAAYGLKIANDLYYPKQTYTPEEKSFVQEAKQYVGNDDLILNIPYDGSELAHELDNLNVYYRCYFWFDSADPPDTDPSILIRHDLNKVASDSAVQKAVSEAGARYVMLLDTREHDVPVSGYHEAPYTHYQDSDWSGFEIHDDTPGFKVVLSEGDLRLYQIEY